MSLFAPATRAVPQAAGARVPEHYVVAMAQAFPPSARHRWHVLEPAPSLKRAPWYGCVDERLCWRARGSGREIERADRESGV